MKKRILFVDDAPLLLAGLQRSLRPLRGEWEMEFLDSGAKALARLAEQPFDAVVTDLHMPGMSGVELLDEVLKRHPKTVRVILSGTADKQFVTACVGSTHQYLAKPCPPETLKATLQRAFNLQEACENEALKELVCRLSHLPSVPGLYREIVTACNQPDASMEEVSRIIARDLGMSSLILKAVNCAFFGLARPMASVEEAAAYLGTETIKTLVLSLQTFSEFKAPPTGSFTVERLWAHSQRVAARAQQIARLENAERRLLDETFTAGMLHDIGKLVLAANLPTEYEQVAALARSGSLELHAAEKQVFGASHAEVGGYLLGLWGLPESIVEAVARHHTPSAATASAFSPLTAVHVAEVLEWEESLAQPRPGGPQLDAEYLAALRVSERLSVWRESSTAALEQLAA